jgi:predicted secreted hydrolase
MRRRSLALAGLVLLLAVAGVALALFAAGRAQREPVRATLSTSAVLGAGDTSGFERALAPRAFRFPADHGPHPGFRNEWWYFTGNLEAPDGRRFGYELTFFRSALVAREPPRASNWAARDAYMAHFAITDHAGGRFLARDRFARGAAGLAGASAPDASGRGAGWRVWLEDWAATSDAARGRHGDTATRRSQWPMDPAVTGDAGLTGATEAPGGAASPRPRVAVMAFWPIHLAAQDSGMRLDLTLGEGKAPVLEGEGGLSRKGPEPGNASYYYSLTRMPSAGWVEVGGRRFRVAGESWMDREWSTSALGRDEVGWDWFALQLSDGRELMLYRIRRRPGGISPFSAGTLVERDGSSRVLAAADARVDVLGSWASPRDGARYPAHWRVRVPGAGLDLEVRPIVADQELNLAVRYWEGAVDVRGVGAGGAPLTGRGYVELTGYGGGATQEGGPAARGR